MHFLLKNKKGHPSSRDGLGLDITLKRKNIYDKFVKSQQDRHPRESGGPDTVPAETGNQTIEPGFPFSGGPAGE
jgi:hypothetical protein